MKRYITFTVSLLLIVLMIFSFTSCTKVEVEDGAIIAVFRYGDVDISEPLTYEDSKVVREIFNGKYLYSDSLFCGFGEDVALIINGDTYCIACDSCGTIYDIKEDKYFELSDKETEILHNLLGKYGFIFPCV